MHFGHELAEEQIREIVEASDGRIELHRSEIGKEGNILQIELTLPFQPIKRAPTGLPVRARERFLICVGKDFPYEYPNVFSTHRRFAGFAHVQWAKYLCLYQSSTDWKPADGMYGFIRRLDGWIRDGALDKLDPDDAPLHPPANYPKSKRLVVPKKDTPELNSDYWLGFAEIKERENRTEIVDWVELGGPKPDKIAGVFLLPKPFPFEYPRKILDLTEELKKQGLPYAQFMRLLSLLALLTPAGTPFLVVLGTPMRRVDVGGPLVQHLAIWEINATNADELRLFNGFFSDDPTLKEIGDIAKDKIVEWSVRADIHWCNVREMRPEVTKRRDHDTATTWFKGKAIELWGCGALGSHIAESIVRAGARRILLRDRGKVMPGLLVRQSFDDEDIGDLKTDALKRRLLRIDPDVDVQVFQGDILDNIGEDKSLGDCDLIIDTTGSSSIRLKLERRLRSAREYQAIASMAISYDAQFGVATLSQPESNGGIADIFRRLKLKACLEGKLRPYRDAFWPYPPRKRRFQPEPGCSEPTFIGSNADIAALGNRMLNAIGKELSDTTLNGDAVGWFLSSQGRIHSFTWRNDVVIGDGSQRYQVRLSSGVVREMRAWTRRSTRLRGREIETGGLLFGELNEAAGVLWVSAAEGPPPDSKVSAKHFQCGVEGMSECNHEKRDRTQGSEVCIGSWHTHPKAPARPSGVDLQGVMEILADADSMRRHCLLLILGIDPDSTSLIGAYVFRTISRSDEVVTGGLVVSGETVLPPPGASMRKIGLGLSGGGSRAIAFHLGCLRALNDLGLLNCIQAVSCVSGGAVIGALYAYHDENFSAFDKRITKLLRHGLVGNIVTEWLLSLKGLLALITWPIFPVLDLLRTVFGRMPFGLGRIVPWLDPKLKPPRRRYSRTEAFRDALEKIFRGRRMEDIQRRGLDVVITATDLRSGSAFRYGSQETGCWRYGEYKKVCEDEALVADAVAASAAYPVFLPALERDYSFRDTSHISKERVILADGGVFDNLGVSCFDPERRSSISTNVFHPERIIACDAGTGILEMDSFPMSWITRMKRSYITTHRKTQDATRARLHKLAQEGDIQGFILPYLGQQDKRLPWQPADLPSRSDVSSYPTDFSSMAQEDIERLALRGERLVRLLVAHYWPDI